MRKLILPLILGLGLWTATVYGQSITRAAGRVSQLVFSGTTFANLGTPGNGIVTYCSDCTIANPCAGVGTGAIAKRLNGVWVCN